MASSSGMLSLSKRDWPTFQELSKYKKELAEVVNKLNTSMRGSK
jgi:hypothetical protein